MDKKPKKRKPAVAKKPAPKRKKAVVKVVSIRPLDPVLVLLRELRANPTEDCIQRIVNAVNSERCEYYNLGKAIAQAVKRPFTEIEHALVIKLS